MSKPNIKIGHIAITDHLVLGVAKAKASAGELPLELSTLETVCFEGWQEVGNAFSEGAIDGAFILAPYAMDLFKSGEKAKLLLLGHKNGSILIKNKAANIKTITDFKGKTIIIPYQLSVHNMLIHKLLTEKGLTPGAGKDVMLEVMAPAQIPIALEYDEEGEIGGFIVAEPFGSQVVKKGIGEEMALSRDVWPGHPCCVFIVNEKILGQNYDAVQELVNNFVKAGQLITTNPHEAAAIGAGFLNQDRDVVEKILTSPADRITTDELMPVRDDLAKMHEYITAKLTVSKSTVDLDRFVDTKLAETAGAK
ncbi:MAG TPA: ABC transporter substrate-binding protein [Spirochaetota bacterium]|nr:ABC transporter substrate-binding protein [Spirochaetota bacterium]